MVSAIINDEGPKVCWLLWTCSLKADNQRANNQKAYEGISMIKNILLYKWHAYTEPYLISNLEEMGYHCVVFDEKFEDYHADAVFVMKVVNCIRAENIDMIFSIDYLPLLASAGKMCELPYAAWIYDCPQHTLLSKTTLYPNNFLFFFDSAYAQQLIRQGCTNVFHLPLAVDMEFFEKSIQSAGTDACGYAADISFVGNLYTEKEKWLQTEGIPEYVKGYLEGIEEAQIRVYGYNFVKEMIEEDVARDILQKAELLLNDLYFDNPVQLVADLVNWEISQKERLRVIERLGKTYPLHLYTKSHFEARDNIKLCGPVDYQREMPLVFHNSKINLHITSKTIETGISQRVLDILACGGFCLANYQPEIAEYFEDGKELVMYTDMEDLVQKADWYLKHDDERSAIAGAGYEKVRELFSIKDRLTGIIETVEGNWNG